MSDFTCTLRVGGLCGKPAAEALIIQHETHSEAFPRCPEHPAEGYIKLVKKLHPQAACAVVSLERA